MLKLISSLFTRKARTVRNRKTFVANPRIETLEDRLALTASLPGGYLNIVLNDQLGQHHAVISNLDANNIQISYDQGKPDVIAKSSMTDSFVYWSNTDPKITTDTVVDQTGNYFILAPLSSQPPVTIVPNPTPAPLPPSPAPAPKPAPSPAPVNPTYGAGKNLSVGKDAQGYDEVWLQATDNHIYRLDHGTWTDTKGFMTTIQAGRGEVFGITTSGLVYVYSDQTGGWVNKGTGFKNLSVGTDAQGGDEAWLLGNDNTVWRYDHGQTTYATKTFQSIQAGHGEFFGISTSNDFYSYSDQSGLSNGALGHAFHGLSVGTDALGADEVWVLGNDGTTWRYDHGQMNRVVSSYTFTTIQAGKSEFFGVTATGAAFSFQDSNPNVLTPLGTGVSNLAVGINGQNLDEVWLGGSDRSVARYNGGQWNLVVTGMGSLHAGQGEVFGLDANGVLYAFKDSTGLLYQL